MKIDHGSKRARIADLYLRSKSLKFGAFELAAHKTDPTLPLSPHYLHFPKEGQEGYELLEEMETLIAEVFYDMIMRLGLRFRRIGAVPKGAQGIAAKLAKMLEAAYPKVLLVFDKEDRDGDNYFLGPIEGEFKIANIMLGIEDHTSGGHNKRLFLECLERCDLLIADFLTVVDRMQGGVAFLASKGVTMHSIFTMEELLVYYVETNQLEEAKAVEVRKYIAANQLFTPAA